MQTTNQNNCSSYIFMGHSRPLFYFCLFNTADNKQMFSLKVCQWLDSNCGPLVSEVTALPTEPQPQLGSYIVKEFDKLISSWYLNWFLNLKLNFCNRKEGVGSFSDVDSHRNNFKWLKEETHNQKVVSSNPGTRY